MTTSFIIWPPCMHAITLLCTKVWHASPAHLPSPTGQQMERPGIRWPEALKIIRTSGLVRWRSQSRWHVVNTLQLPNCPSIGANIDKLLSGSLERLIAEWEVSFSMETDGHWKMWLWRLKDAMLRSRQLNTENSGAFYCQDTIGSKSVFSSIFISTHMI